MRGLNDANVLLRRELFTVRDAMSCEFKTSLNSERKTAVGMMQTELFQHADLKLTSFEVKVSALQTSSMISAECTRKMAQYLEDLDQFLPQEGSEFEKSCRGIITQVGRVKIQVTQFH